MKKNWQTFGVSSLVITLLCSSGHVWADDDNHDFKPRRKRVVVIDAEPHHIDEEEIVRQAPKYWLGIQCEVSDDGVSIDKVLPNSPAEKAGLKAGDLVRKINGVDIDDVKHLIENVQNSKGEPLAVSVLRDEEVVSVEVKPDKMPNRFTRRPAHPDFFFELPNGRNFFNNEDFDMHFVNPGFVFDGADDFPENASIKIERKNDEPTKLTIERDGEKWVVDEDSIDKLPKDLQGWAKKMLSQSRNRIRMRAPNVRPFDALPNHLRERFRFNTDESEDIRVNGRNDEIKELREEIKELRKLIEELKKD